MQTATPAFITDGTGAARRAEMFGEPFCVVAAGREWLLAKVAWKRTRPPTADELPGRWCAALASVVEHGDGIALVIESETPMVDGLRSRVEAVEWLDTVSTKRYAAMSK